MEKDADLIVQLQQSYKTHGGVNQSDDMLIPSRHVLQSLVDHLFDILAPGIFRQPTHSISELLEIIQTQLIHQILLKISSQTQRNMDQIACEFVHYLPKLRGILHQDLQAMYQGDPAATSLEEIMSCYPGYYAIAMYRMAHFLYLQDIKILPRMMTELAHRQTGIDIHPGAKIGQYFCIDHGTGIVIGETAEIGENVKLYQGVTLGALSIKNRSTQRKRHPTLKDNVVVYARTTILGGDTVIGKDSIIGGNVWITASVPERSKIYISSNQTQISKKREDMVD